MRRSLLRSEAMELVSGRCRTAFTTTPLSMIWGCLMTPRATPRSSPSFLDLLWAATLSFRSLAECEPADLCANPVSLRLSYRNVSIWSYETLYPLAFSFPQFCPSSSILFGIFFSSDDEESSIKRLSRLVVPHSSRYVCLHEVV